MLSPDMLFDGEVAQDEGKIEDWGDEVFPKPVVLPVLPSAQAAPAKVPGEHYAPAKETGWHKEKKATYRGGREKKKMVGSSEMTPAERAAHYSKVNAAMADYIAKNGAPVCKRIKGDVRDGEITVNF